MSRDPAHWNLFDEGARRNICLVARIIGLYLKLDMVWFYLLNYLFFCFTVDTPDPYLMMRIPTAPEMVQRTKCVSNNKNPVWKEEPFVFHIDPELENVLGW